MQVRSEETRSRISQVAASLFSQKGYDATGVAEICEKAEVSKGAFYHHFASKQELFACLLEFWLSGIDSSLKGFMDAAANVPKGLLAMADEMKEVYAAADGQLGLFLEFWEQARHDPEIRTQFIAPYRRYQEFFAGIVQRGIAEGSFRNVDPQMVGQALVALAVGIVVQGVIDPQAAAWDKVTRSAVELMLQGMERR